LSLSFHLLRRPAVQLDEPSGRSRTEQRMVLVLVFLFLLIVWMARRALAQSVSVLAIAPGSAAIMGSATDGAIPDVILVRAGLWIVAHG
jgi:hypothetical protein